MKTPYNDPLWDVTLYYFLGVCMFECIPPQTFEKISQYFLHIMLKYDLGKILEKNISFQFIMWEIEVYCEINVM